jgi:predicted ATPase/DNA-binding SARP family transcriptional activator
LLKLYLLGPPRVELNENEVHIRRRKALALLVYLALTGRAHSRDALATLFSPDLDQRRARTYFRRDLGALNTQLEGEWLAAGRETVGLIQPAELWTDVAAFRELLAPCQLQVQADPECLSPLTQAVTLYGDHFLAGFSLPDCPEFDEWQFFEAENLRQDLAASLERLIAIHSELGQYEHALPFARRWLQLDPLHEPAQRSLMRLYALTGQQAAALRQYEIALASLDEELGVRPEQATTRLYEAIKVRRLGQPGVQTETVWTAQTRVGAAASEVLPGPQPTFLAEVDAPGEPSSAVIFVGRERELSQLAAAAASAKSGHGQILFVIGGTGRGKTALVQEFARRAQEADADLVAVGGNCNAITGLGDPYLPFRDALIMLTGDVEARLAGGLISRRQARQLWDLMPLTLPALVKHGLGLVDGFIPGQALRERAALVRTDDSAWPSTLTALTAGRPETIQDQKRIFAQYTAVLKAIAEQRPLLLIIEDLHWVDAASSSLLFHLSREMSESRILVLGTYRPEEIASDRGTASAAGQAGQHPLAPIIGELKRQHGDIWLDLGDLASSEGRHFVDAYLDTQPNALGQEFREALFQRTEGHALFTVELLQAMQERGDLRQDDQGRWLESGVIDWAKLPARVEGVIESIIERLAEELQAILTIASVEGEVFTAEVVARVQQLDQHTLVRQLSRDLDKRQRLIEAQSLQVLESGQRLASYRFRHQLFQHYLYSRLDDVERGYLHEAVGSALEELYEGQTGQVAGQLARHFELAGLLPKAVRYLTDAGNAAAAVHANIEAAAFYNRAATLAEQIGADSEELAHLYVSLGGQLMVTKGDGSPEVGQAYGRACELYDPSAESPQRFAALRGTALYRKFRGELGTAQRLSEDMLALASSLQEPVLIVEACYALGSLFFYMGDLRQAGAYLEQGIRSYDRRQHQSLILLYGQDPGVANLCYAAVTLWLLGYPDQALQRSAEALALAQELSHPYSLAMAYSWSVWLHAYRREKQAVLERAEAATSLSAKHNFTVFLGVGKFMSGWALARQADLERGISQMEQGLAEVTLATGSGDERIEFLPLLAEAYGRVGRPQRGLELLSKALAFAEQSSYMLWGQPELYRLKGELLSLHGGPAASVEAEVCFRRAIDAASRQGARSLELRAVMSLCRLWQSQGKREQARQMLFAIYDWFSEGFDTLDLQEAMALLDQLA